ncbi:MAG: superoxide dismutase family protein [Lutibacter sp.]
MKNYLFILLIVAFFIGCSDINTKKAVVNIMAKSNSNVTGTVTFTETDGLVSMTANISGLTPGNHAIHIHAIGDCSADDGSSAGGHWNPTNVNHGKWGTAPFHIGDIGNIVADSTGSATISRETDLWCINCDDVTKNIIGKSIVIHEGIDDFTSQPAGAAGIRIGCGEIIPQ